MKKCPFCQSANLMSEDSFSPDSSDSEERTWCKDCGRLLHEEIHKDYTPRKDGGKCSRQRK